MTLEEAIRHAVRTNPQVLEANANRRATEREIRQVQGGLLPQVRLQADMGVERVRQFDALRIGDPDRFRGDSRSAGVVVRQVLWDGMATINEIYRQMARADAAAWRSFERSELIALDTAESYVDIVRLSQAIEHARQNVAAHRSLLANVQRRFTGGRAGTGDRSQVMERLKGAESTLADFTIRLGEAQAAFRRAVGREPTNLRLPGRLTGIPLTRADALEAALAQNPTIQAARADEEAVRRQFDAAAGAYSPTIALEGRHTAGRNTGTFTGNYDQTSLKLVASWDIFRGGTDTARRLELAERFGEVQARRANLQRAAFQSIDRAWTARVNSGQRIASLREQVRAAEQVVRAYRSEYEIGQRTLLDLLNAENAVFNARINLASAVGVAVYSDYQLLATTGTLLRRLNIERPQEGNVTPRDQRSVLPRDIILTDPGPLQILPDPQIRRR